MLALVSLDGPGAVARVGRGTICWMTVDTFVSMKGPGAFVTLFQAVRIEGFGLMFCVGRLMCCAIVEL